MQFRGYLYVLAAATLWGLIGPISKLAFQEGLDPFEISFWRAAIGWAAFAAHSLSIRRTRIDLIDLPIVSLFGLVGVSVFYLSYQWAVRSGGAALASVLLYTAPAWVALLSRLVLGERMGSMKVLAVAMTLAGVALVSCAPGPTSGSSQGSASTTAILCGLTSGFTYALYFIFGKLYLHRYSTPTLFLYAMPVGAAGLLPFVTFHRTTGLGVAAVLILASCCTYLAYSVYYAGLRRVEATRAAVVATLEPVLAALIAFLWWDERFTPLGYIGSGLILAAVAVTIWDSRRRPAAEALAAPEAA
jgi:DME family drug/metabolite transporter